jgi:hypothetical protein
LSVYFLFVESLCTAFGELPDDGVDPVPDNLPDPLQFLCALIHAYDEQSHIRVGVIILHHPGDDGSYKTDQDFSFHDLGFLGLSVLSPSITKMLLGEALPGRDIAEFRRVYSPQMAAV